MDKYIDKEGYLRVAGVEGLEDVRFPSDLPVPTKSITIPEVKIIEIAKYICQLFSMNVCTIKKACAFFSVSYWVFNNWTKTIEKVKSMYESSKKDRSQLYFESLRDQARTSLQKRVAGEYVIEKTITKRIPTIKEKKGGLEVTLMEDITEKQKYIPPSVGAIMYVLNNIDGSNFEKTPEPIKSGDKNTSIPLIDWVSGSDHKEEE